jgi:hypothetical protein
MLISFFSSVVGLNVLSTLYINATTFNNIEFSTKLTAEVNSPFELTLRDSNRLAYRCTDGYVIRLFDVVLSKSIKKTVVVL